MQGFSTLRFQPPRKRQRLRILLSFVCVALLATAARSFTLSESLWLDELHTSWTVAGSLAEVAGRAADGNQPPLYFWLVWFIVRIVGASEIGLRILSLVAGFLVIVTLGLFVRRWAGSTSLAMLATSLAAIDPNFTYYAREARPYVLIQLFAIAHMHVFLSCVSLPRPRLRASWVGLTWLMFFTHYTSVLLVPAELAWLLVATWLRGDRRIDRRWVWDVLICTMGCMCALMPLHNLFERRRNWEKFVFVDGIADVWTIFPCGAYVLVPLSVVAVFAVLLRSPSVECVRFSRRFWRYTSFFICVYLVPVLLTWFSTRLAIAPLFFRRYVIASSVPLVVLGAWWGMCLASTRLRRRYAWLTWVAIVVGVGGIPRVNWMQHNRENWRHAIAFLDRQSDQVAWPILLRGGIIEDDALGQDDDPRLAAYCRFPVAGIYSLEPQTAVVPMPSRRELSANDLPSGTVHQLRHHRAAWIVCRGSVENANQFFERLQVVLSSIGMAVERREQRRFAGISVVELSLR